MGMMALLFACSSTSTSNRKDMQRVVCKLVGVEKDVALFENRRTEPDGKLIAVWTNRVDYKSLALDGKKENPLKAAVDDYVKELKVKAEDGDPARQYQVGLLYEAGRFVAKDDPQALMWFLRAGMQGHAGAQHELGLMYQFGQSAPQDYVEAYKWFELSAKGGEKWSEENRKALAGYMIWAQVTEAKKRAADFKPIKESGK